MSDIIPPDSSKKVGILDAELQSHEDRTDNPHSVTATQTGAYSKTESDGLISGVNSSIGAVAFELSNHSSNTGNPHSTTAGQIGAYTTSQVDQKIADVYPAASDTANITVNQNVPYTWRFKNVFVTVSAAATLTFQSADGWTDKDWVNIWIIANAGSNNLTYAGSGTLTTVNDEGKLKQSKGAITAIVNGTNVRLIGKLSA